MSPPRFPWAEAMALGLGTLRLSPETFWRFTLPELAAAIRSLQPPCAPPMVREEIEALMISYPDADGRSGLDTRKEAVAAEYRPAT